MIMIHDKDVAALEEFLKQVASEEATLLRKRIELARRGYPDEPL